MGGSFASLSTGCAIFVDEQLTVHLHELPGLESVRALQPNENTVGVSIHVDILPAAKDRDATVRRAGAVDRRHRAYGVECEHVVIEKKSSRQFVRTTSSNEMLFGPGSERLSPFVFGLSVLTLCTCLTGL